MTINSAYTVQTTDNGATLGFAGSTYFAVTLAVPSSYASGFTVRLVNEDSGRAKWVIPGNQPPFFLWPAQNVTLTSFDGIWLYRPEMWLHPGGSTGGNLLAYAKPSGSDVLGATDGLDPGMPFATPQAGLGILLDQVKFRTTFDGANTRLVMNLARAYNYSVGFHIPMHDVLGAQGGAAVKVRGAYQDITGAQNDGTGKTLVIIADTSSYSAGQSVMIYGAGSVDGKRTIHSVLNANGLIINVGFTSWTGGGTITDGSGIAINSGSQSPVETYFSTVVQFQDLLFDNPGGFLFDVTKGSVVYLVDGNMFGQTGGTAMRINANSEVELDGAVGILGSMPTIWTGAGTFQNNGAFL